MKKLFIILFACVLAGNLFSSCEDTSEKDTFCWLFTISVTTSYGGHTEGTTSTSTQCGLTESQAEQVRASAESTTTTGGITITTRVTKTKTGKS